MNHPTLWGQSSSAAGQAVPDSVPVIVPDGGYALSGLRSPVYQTVIQHRRLAQAQRRRASCTRLRSRRCAGWRLTPYPAYLHPSSKACASRGIPVASPESPHPHDDAFVYSLTYQAESLKLKTILITYPGNKYVLLSKIIRLSSHLTS